MIGKYYNIDRIDMKHKLNLVQVVVVYYILYFKTTIYPALFTNSKSVGLHPYCIPGKRINIYEGSVIIIRLLQGLHTKDIYKYIYVYRKKEK